MDTENPAKERGSNTVPGCAPHSYGEPDEPAAGLSPVFILFAVFLVGAAAVAGSVKSGKLNLNRFFNVPQSGAQANPAPIAAPRAAAKPAAPAPPLKPDTFVVTSISIGQPSFAIINGTSRVEGDPVEAPGATGWKVKRITDGEVLLQNGSTITTIPLSAPGIKPLDDQLHPLN